MTRPLARLAALALLAATLALLLAPADAAAIPAFARRYRFGCATCHAPFPRLEPYGEEFAGRGFALPPGEEPARSELDVGDPLLRLPRELPLAVRFDAFAAGQDRDPEVDLQSPWVVKLLAGGRIADGVGFYAYYILEEGEAGTLEDAYVQLSDVLGLPVNLLVGQFQLSDPIAKRELRLERLDYQVLKTRVGASVVDLTYDRGLALTASAGPVDVVVTVTNGTGIGPAASGTYDPDPYKNVSLDLAAGAGPVSVGLFGFRGKERLDGGVNETVYLGPRLGLALGDHAEVRVVYLERRDSDPDPASTGLADVVTRGGFGEVIVLPGGPDGRLALAALYNRVDSDLDGSDAESAALTLSWLHRRNVRLVLEGQRDLLAEVWAGSAGVVVAF